MVTDTIIEALCIVGFLAWYLYWSWMVREDERSRRLSISNRQGQERDRSNSS